MFRTAGPFRVIGSLSGWVCLLLLAATASAQTSTGSFITGPAAAAWESWSEAMRAILDRDRAQAEEALGKLLELDPSPFRVALLADHTINRTAAGGAVLLFEQDYEAEALGTNGREVADRLMTGREQMNEADDGFYFCQIGRFDVADANFQALLNANPDPVAVLEFTDRVPKRRTILLQLLNNPIVGDSCRRMLAVLAEGELEIKADPTRIKENIERLGGPPRAFGNAVEALKDSGEFAVPFIVQHLRDPEKKQLIEPILRALPQIDRPALNPLVIALRVGDPVTKRYLVEALGEIGYAQAVPYLLQLRAEETTVAMVRAAVNAALEKIRAAGTGVPADQSAAQAFFDLAEQYYADRPSLAADPRLTTANVWYWRDDLLQNVRVPTSIFNEIMTMRCCEEALRLEPEFKRPLALWLAANFRRDAQLPQNEVDPTRPAEYPPPIFFAQSAGPDYCLMALARAVEGADPAVALGCIYALKTTAGSASLVTDAEGRLPLAEALSFPDRMVRIQAGLTLGRARPRETFNGYQNLMPVLSEALQLHGGARYALVIDPDAESANAVAGALRSEGFDTTIDASLYSGLQKVRDTLPGIDVICLTSDMREPALAAALSELRGEFRFAAVPVVLITKPGDSELVGEIVRADHRLIAVPVQPRPEELTAAVEAVSRAVGVATVTPEVGTLLAMEAAEVLRLLVLTNNPVFDVRAAEPALLHALGSADPELRVLVAEVLGHLESPAAQEAIAGIALDANEAEDMRVAMFTALADAAKRRGNLLEPGLVQQLVELTRSADSMTIREAASRTLGALNVPGEPASEMIRSLYAG